MPNTKTTKEKILEEFDEKFNRCKLTFDECASLDADYWDARKFLSQAIAQTREETIRDLLSSVQENRDEFFKGENDRGFLYYNGLIDLLNKILNKLKK